MCPQKQRILDSDTTSAVFYELDAEILENGKVFQNLFGTDL